MRRRHHAIRACDTAKRQQIMEGARRIFLQDGFDGASIGDIVRAAGVSKGTLYAYFPSKEKLFEALIFEDRRKQAEVLFTLDESDLDVARRAAAARQNLSRHAAAARQSGLPADRRSAHRRNSPQSARLSSRRGPATGRARLASYLRRLTEQGVLAVEDPELAARQFLDLCKTGIHLRMMLGDRTAPDPDEIDRNLDSAIEVFLAAYGGSVAAS